MNKSLPRPHGGELKWLIVGQDRAAELRAASGQWPSWDLTDRQLCDLELLLNGAFSPLEGFMTRAQYETVVQHMRLPDGLLWPVPVVLDVSEDLARRIGPGAKIALRDREGVMLAILHVEDVWQPDHIDEAQAVYGTTNQEHPGVHHLLNQTRPFYVGGRIEGLELPHHFDFKDIRLGPREVRRLLGERGWDRVVAFQTRNPMHRAHFELTLRATREVEGKLLIHPVVGATKPGDVDHYTRVRCYRALLPHYPPDTAMLSLLPLAMRMAGPREALWHGIIRKNFGCTHLIVGRDHAGPGKDANGNPFYDHYAAQDLFSRHQDELGIRMVPFKMMVYVREHDRYAPVDELPEGVNALNISGTELRRLLAEGREIPAWFTFPEVAAELRRRYPSRRQQGFAVFFTGLSGAGKSTLAKALAVKLLELDGRQVTILDGDYVRKNLSSGLGFSKEDRDLNIRRIGFVASEIAKHGGYALCAAIAPYDSARVEVRRMVESSGGGFILVHVATPLEVCEQRDRKGLYTKARAGIIKNFTGISDPYEPPSACELTIDTSNISPEKGVEKILTYLKQQGFLDRS